MRRFLRHNGLFLVNTTLFLLFLFVGQLLVGHREYNHEKEDHGEQTIGLAEYIRTAHYGEATFENWQSEFLQMGSYVLFTVWLRQRGSPESKNLTGEDPVDEDPARHRDNKSAPWPVRRGGIALALYRNSLFIAFAVLFLLSWWLHAVTGAREYSSDQEAHGGQPVDTVEYVTTSRFWFETFQNWQSEYLAVAAIVTFGIYLRQQGSPESKPVHAAHRATGSG